MDQSNDLHRKNRVEGSSLSYRNIILPQKPESSISFKYDKSKINPKKILKRSLFLLKSIAEGKNDLFLNLLQLKQHLKFLYKLPEIDLFCEEFPYPFFFKLVIDGPTLDIKKVSLIIFTYCTNSVKFPRNSFANINNINFLLKLFVLIEPKYHKYIFKILNETILHRYDIRDYLLQNGIINFFDVNSKKSVEFLVTCLSSDSRIDIGFVNTINAFLILSMKSEFENSQKKSVKTGEAKHPIILTVLSIFNRRKKNQCNTICDPNFVSRALIDFIFNDVIQMKIIETIVPILKIASYINLDDEHFIPLTMNFLENVPNKGVIRCCLKILKAKFESWKEHNEISERILLLLNSNKNIPFLIKQSLVQVLMLYIPLNAEIDPSAVEHVLSFINDKQIGANCISFVFYSFSFIMESNRNEAKQRIMELFDENVAQIEEIAMGNGRSEESRPFALKILEMLDK